MATYIAMLRGINVSGQKKILMNDLRTWLSSSGLGQVRSYIQSGNLLFESEGLSKPALEKHISAVLEKHTGWDIPCWVRTANDFQTILDKNPFPGAYAEDHRRFLITFLKEKSSTDIDLDASKYAPDTFRIQGDLVYVFAPGGYGKSKLSNNFFESKLKQPATTRNWKTVLTLLSMANDAQA